MCEFDVGLREGNSIHDDAPGYGAASTQVKPSDTNFDLAPCEFTCEVASHPLKNLFVYVTGVETNEDVEVIEFVYGALR